MTTEDVENRVRSAVASLGLPYRIIDCDPDLADTAEFCAHYGYRMDESANTILVASRRPPGQHALCVVLASTRLDVNGTVRRRLGVRKVSFAPAGVTRDVTGMTIGGVTPFGAPADLPVWVDSRVMECDEVILGGGSRSIKVLIAPEALEKVGAEVVEDLAKVT